MARTGVTYLDVAKAAEAVQQQGYNPTVDRVLAHLGRGSKSTIAPHLKRWKSDQGEGMDTGGLPDDLLKTVKAVHERLQQVADEKIREAKKASDDVVEELKDQLYQAKIKASQLEMRIKDLEIIQEKLANDKGSLRNELETERVRNAKLEEAANDSTNNLAESKDTVQEQKREIKQIRRHFEHYQTSVAEDRQQEREQHRSVTNQLEGRIQELTRLLQDEKQRTTVLENERQQAEDSLVRLQDEFNQLKKDHQALKLDTVRKEDAIKHLESDAYTFKQQIAKLEVKRDELSAAKTDLTTTTHILEKDIARLNKALSYTEDKITQLADDNKFLSQEKSNIEGQFKQLQRSLK